MGPRDDPAKREGPVGQGLRDPGGQLEGVASLEDLEALGGLGLLEHVKGENARDGFVSVDPTEDFCLPGA